MPKIIIKSNNNVESSENAYKFLRVLLVMVLVVSISVIVSVGMDIKTKMDHFLYFFKFIQLTKLQKSFNKIKNYSYLKKRQKEQKLKLMRNVLKIMRTKLNKYYKK